MMRFAVDKITVSEIREIKAAESIVVQGKTVRFRFKLLTYYHYIYS